jgi:hypothetical protein
MARPQVADGGDGLQIWRVAAKILKKMSPTADNGWSSSLGVSRGLTTLHRKKMILLRNITKGLGLGRIILINELSLGKTDMRFGTWNIRGS